MSFNFDEIIPRNGTHSVKWDYDMRPGGAGLWDKTDPAVHGEERILTMWVADMDFRVAPCIQEAMHQVADHGIFGYVHPAPSYNETVAAWFKRRQSWEVDPDWVTISPATVPLMQQVIASFSKPGDAVIIQPPVYHPFPMIAERNGCSVLRNNLVLNGSRYEMDFDDLEEKAKQPEAKIMLLCTPHNPVSRIWSKEELSRVADICAENGVLVIADEVHSDLIAPGYSFVPFAEVSEAAANNTIISTAPSKAFNLAGLGTSNTIVPNAELRATFRTMLKESVLVHPNTFGTAATLAAYAKGDEWLDAAMAYIAGNAQFVADFCAEKLPQIVPHKLEATYLQWLDFRALGLSNEELASLMFDKAKIYFNEGYTFGELGSGFERMNLATPRANIELAMQRIEKVLGDM